MNYFIFFLLVFCTFAPLAGQAEGNFSGNNLKNELLSDQQRSNGLDDVFKAFPFNSVNDFVKIELDKYEVISRNGHNKLKLTLTTYANVNAQINLMLLLQQISDTFFSDLDEIYNKYQENLYNSNCTLSYERASHPEYFAYTTRNTSGCPKTVFIFQNVPTEHHWKSNTKELVKDLSYFEFQKEIKLDLFPEKPNSYFLTENTVLFAFQDKDGNIVYRECFELMDGYDPPLPLFKLKNHYDQQTVEYYFKANWFDSLNRDYVPYVVGWEREISMPSNLQVIENLNILFIKNTQSGECKNST